ncbi:hypothetical protein K503DRAFT_513111 [Rhizopogon vinicolor AM-OR11-026]|uniref:Uncharacterized protein n=1 Tax=Rhizopogon vinicolor AM-OR11-026 TaxID=1314800 RepID=A0A1B7MLX7_9AGAM|nr:hypothetical protein K503DRAFT_513111 [Rhizopogon vinicolor AM-OR11-026]
MPATITIQMSISFPLPWMPAILAHAEGGDFTNTVYRSFLASCSTSYFLTSTRRRTCLPAPTILGIRGSSRCVVPLLISWESQLTSAHRTQVEAGTPSGAPPE